MRRAYTYDDDDDDDDDDDEDDDDDKKNNDNRMMMMMIMNMILTRKRSIDLSMQFKGCIYEPSYYFKEIIVS